MSEGTDELRTLADALDKVEAALAYISASESPEDEARTLADNEVFHRVAGKLREAADAAEANEG